MFGPDILEDPDNRDTVITVLNAMDSRVDARLRAVSIMEIAVTVIESIEGRPNQHQIDKSVSFIGCLVGIALKICDEHSDEVNPTIDAYRKIVKNAAEGR